MQRALVICLILAACGNDPDYTPIDGGEPVVSCPFEPDAATPLGTRGVDLWDDFVGAYELRSTVVRLQSPGSRVVASTLGTLDVQVRVTRTEELTPGLMDCASVAVPVRVAITAANPATQEDVLGVLSGSQQLALVSFGSDDRIPADGVPGGLQRVSGRVTFQYGMEPRLELAISDLSFISPPLAQATP